MDVSPTTPGAGPMTPRQSAGLAGATANRFPCRVQRHCSALKVRRFPEPGRPFFSHRSRCRSQH